MYLVKAFTKITAVTLLALNTASFVHGQHHGEQVPVASGSSHMKNIPVSFRAPDFNQAQHFLFSEKNTAVKAIDHKSNEYLLDADSHYTNDRGYGFDLNTRMNDDGAPFYFSAQVPEGNYRVTINFGHSEKASSNTVKAESRRLYIEDANTQPGEFITRNFIVNVRTANLTPPDSNAPGGVRVALKKREQDALHWDEKLTLEFNGSSPQVSSVTLQKVDVPTIYLVGDSTVTDQAYEPAASWGQMLPRFFEGDIAIANHAESGETLKSFITSLRFAKVLETIKSGDYLFIQFGHNDQKQQWPQTYVAADTTYKDYLRVFIAEAQLRGATPVLVTSMQRRTFDKRGKILNSHGAYPQAVREVAHEKELVFIDLDQMSVNLYEALGVDQAPLAFNDNGKDKTHHNNYGAYQLAKCVIQALRSSELPLVDYISSDLPSYNPAQPDSVIDFNLSASPRKSALRPEGS